MNFPAGWAVLAAMLGLSGCAGVLAAQELDGEAETNGARAYQKCFACHAVQPGPDDRDGPTLSGIVGRRVASVPGFAYSPAMQTFAERQERWSREALDAYLADPQALIPDNSMGFFGMPDAEERADLIEWLARQTGQH